MAATVVTVVTVWYSAALLKELLHLHTHPDESVEHRKVLRGDVVPLPHVEVPRQALFGLGFGLEISKFE